MKNPIRYKTPELILEEVQRRIEDQVNYLSDHGLKNGRHHEYLFLKDLRDFINKKHNLKENRK